MSCLCCDDVVLSSRCIKRKSFKSQYPAIKLYNIDILNPPKDGSLDAKNMWPYRLPPSNFVISSKVERIAYTPEPLLSKHPLSNNPPHIHNFPDIKLCTINSLLTSLVCNPSCSSSL